jgi:hypothetical protein
MLHLPHDRYNNTTNLALVNIRHILRETAKICAYRHHALPEDFLVLLSSKFNMPTMDNIPL